jgi:hypothetical protein
MTRQMFTILSLMALTCGLSLAADIDGRWTAELPGRNGAVTQTLTLKADGNNLTGSMEGRRGGSVDISDGTINGSDVSFKVVREFNGNQITQEYKGTLSGGELKLTVSGGRAPAREIVFKKLTS